MCTGPCRCNGRPLLLVNCHLWSDQAKVVKEVERLKTLVAAALQANTGPGGQLASPFGDMAIFVLGGTHGIYA